MDIRYILIGQQVCSHSARKHENDVSNMVYWLSSSCDNLQFSSAKLTFVRIWEQVKTLDCISGFHWSVLEFSQTFASFFTRLSESKEKMFYFFKLLEWPLQILARFLSLWKVRLLIMFNTNNKMLSRDKTFLRSKLPSTLFPMPLLYSIRFSATTAKSSYYLHLLRSTKENAS